MNPEELREQLPGAAGLAGPPELDTALLVRRVRRGRLARRALTGGAALALAAAAALGAVRWSGPGGGADAAGPSDDPYACGRRPSLAGPATANGVTLSVASVRRAGDDAGPVIEAGFRTDRAFEAIGSPPNYLEVLYLRDGVVVGGGPVLKRPGDRYEQGVDAVGYVYHLTPDSPLRVPLGARDGLCPSVRWSQVWAEPERYEVVLLVDPPVELNGPPPTGLPQLLVARAPFPR
ncbi:hypothetical protein ACFY00_16740 [Kitasatospora sp. NPDC001540]|uniref:hypothetical protein n=1 Tax=Kitasatospora sp. NPDC001540 TaxID=3364014 RepID=UPI003682CF90